MRLLICDDHRLFIDALTMALTDNGYTVVASALDPDGAVEAARVHQPDVCLLDVTFPQGSGLSAIPRIHAVSPDTKVVILSGSNNSDLVRDAIGQGAQGFVCKTEPVSVMVEALELAHQGELAVDPLVLQSLFSPCPDNDDPLRGIELLTDRERQVLGCIMDGLSTEQMADRLGVSPSTARGHVHTLLTKLGVHTRLKVAALMTAHASGEPWPAHLR